MLLLWRRKGESIRIGSDIVIEVVKTGKTRTQLGISAPRQVQIYRSELLKKPRNGRRKPPFTNTKRPYRHDNQDFNR